MKQIDLIRQEGGLNRYVFRNEARVGDIIKQVLLSSIEILPFFISLEVVENLDVRIPSEDKTKARMRVDYAVVFKDDELVNLELVHKKKERLAQIDDNLDDHKPLPELNNNTTPSEEAKERENSNSKKRKRKSKKEAIKGTTKWRNRKVCLVVSKNKRLLGEVIKKHIQTLRYWWWAESGLIGKDGIKQKRLDPEIRHSGEVKSDIFGIWTDLKEWHFTYYSRKRELDPYLRRDWYAISENIKLYDSYFITEAELKKLISHIRALLIHIAFPSKEMDVIDDIQEVERPNFSFIPQKKNVEQIQDNNFHVDLSKVL